jgi:hypothetical protein
MRSNSLMTYLKTRKHYSCESLELVRPEHRLEDCYAVYNQRGMQTICLKPGTIAVGPKYRKYGTWVRLPELTEVPPRRVKSVWTKPQPSCLSNSLLRGLSIATCVSNSLFTRNGSRLEASFPSGAFTLGDLSTAGLDMVVRTGSGEQLSTARVTRSLDPF